MRTLPPKTAHQRPRMLRRGMSDYLIVSGFSPEHRWLHISM